MANSSVPLADCLRTFNESDRTELLPLINQLRQAIGDDHLLSIQNELLDILTKIVGNLPLSSSPGYFYPRSYIRYSLRLSIVTLNLLRQRVQFFTMPLAQKEFETQTLKLFCLTVGLFINLRIAAMTFSVAADNGDEYRFEIPYDQWCKEHEGQELRFYHNVEPNSDAAAANINRLILKYLPDALHKRFTGSFKRRYLALLSKFIGGDFGSILQDQFLLILISNAEAILREQMTIEFARQGDCSPPYIPSILSWELCALLADELSPEEALRKSDADGNKEHLKAVERTITCKNGEIYAVIDYFFPLLTAKLKELFPRQTWQEKEVLRICCQCGIFDLKEGATFEEVENRIEIYKKGGKEVISTPVKGLRFVNFLLYVPRDSYWSRTIQSLYDKHSLNARDKKQRELGLYKPVPREEWVEKKMMFERVMPIVKLKLDSQLTGESKEVIELMRTAHAKMFESFEEKKRAAEKALKEAKEAKVAPAMLAQLKADFDRAKQDFEEKNKKFDCEHNIKKKQAKEKQSKSEDSSSKPINAPEPSKEMSNTDLIVTDNKVESSVPAIQTPQALKTSGKHIFNAICCDTSRFFRGVAGYFSVHSWLEKRGYRLVKIDPEETSSLNLQNSEVKQISCESNKAKAPKASSLIVPHSCEKVSAESPEARVKEEAPDNRSPAASMERSQSKSFENAEPESSGTANRTETEEDLKTVRKVSKSELQKHLIQRLSLSVENASANTTAGNKPKLTPEELADIEMDDEIKRLASVEAAEKSASAVNVPKEPIAASTGLDGTMAKAEVKVVAQSIEESFSSNPQNNAPKSTDAMKTTASEAQPSKPAAKRGRKKKAEANQPSGTSEKSESSVKTKNAAAAVSASAKTSSKSKAVPTPVATPKTDAIKTAPEQTAAKRGRKPKAAVQPSKDAAVLRPTTPKATKAVKADPHTQGSTQPAPKAAVKRPSALKAVPKTATDLKSSKTQMVQASSLA